MAAANRPAAGSAPLAQFNVAQVLVLCIINFSEALQGNLLWPFLPFAVQRWGAPPEQIGAWVGLLASSFFLAQLLFVAGWGKAADTFGRRPTLLVGLVGTAISMTVFGFARSYEVALLARFLTGALNGNVSIAKTYMGEVVDKNTISKGFSYLSFCWGLGAIVAPVLGGFLAEPTDNYPDLFTAPGAPLAGAAPFLATYPYVLPSLLSVAFALSAFVLGLFRLPETEVFRRGLHRGVVARASAAAGASDDGGDGGNDAANGAGGGGGGGSGRAPTQRELEMTSLLTAADADEAAAAAAMSAAAAAAPAPRTSEDGARSQRRGGDAGPSSGATDDDEAYLASGRAAVANGIDSDSDDDGGGRNDASTAGVRGGSSYTSSAAVVLKQRATASGTSSASGSDSTSGGGIGAASSSSSLAAGRQLDNAIDAALMHMHIAIDDDRDGDDDELGSPSKLPHLKHQPRQHHHAASSDFDAAPRSSLRSPPGRVTRKPVQAARGIAVAATQLAQSSPIPSASAAPPAAASSPEHSAAAIEDGDAAGATAIEQFELATAACVAGASSIDAAGIDVAASGAREADEDADLETGAGAMLAAGRRSRSGSDAAHLQQSAAVKRAAPSSMQRPSTFESDAVLYGPPPVTLAALLRNRAVLLCIAAYGMLSLGSIMFEELNPVFMKTDIAHGGLSFPSRQVGTMQMVAGVTQVINQLLVFPRLNKVVGCLALFRHSMWPLVVMVVFPAVHWLLPFPAAFWPALVALNIVKTLLFNAAFTSIIILVNNSSRGRGLGIVNGFAQACASLARVIGPSLGGAAFSLAVEGNSGGASDALRLHIPYAVMVVFFLAGFVVSFRLPAWVEEPPTFVPAAASGGERGSRKGEGEEDGRRGGVGVPGLDAGH